jgi:signal peptidase I
MSFSWTVGITYLLAAPLLLASSVRAARLVAAPLRSATTIIVLGLLGISANVTVLFGTVLALYPIGRDISREPGLHAGDWIFSVRAPLIGRVRHGDLVAFRYRNAVGTERVVGLPGDRIRVVSGKLIRNGTEVVQSCCQQPFTEYLGNFPLPKDAVFEGDLQYEYRNAYGDRLLNHMEYVVPEESYFLLNDDRNELLDSRLFGPVWAGHIVGRPLLACSAWHFLRLLYRRRW